MTRQTQVIPNDVQVVGSLTAGSFNPPAGCIANSSVAAGAGIEATKLQHQFNGILAQGSSDTVSSEIKVVHIARSAGSVVEFLVGCIVANTSGSVTVDLLKNNASILSAAVAPGAAYDQESGVVASASYVAGDVFEIQITSSSGDAEGVHAQATFRENA